MLPCYALKMLSWDHCKPVILATTKFFTIQKNKNAAKGKNKLKYIASWRRDYIARNFVYEKYMTKKIPSQHSFRFKQCMVIIQKIPTPMTENSTPSYTWKKHHTNIYILFSEALLLDIIKQKFLKCSMLIVAAFFEYVRVVHLLLAFSFFCFNKLDLEHV